MGFPLLLHLKSLSIQANSIPRIIALHFCITKDFKNTNPSLKKSSQSNGTANSKPRAIYTICLVRIQIRCRNFRDRGLSCKIRLQHQQLLISLSSLICLNCFHLDQITSRQVEMRIFFLVF